MRQNTPFINRTHRILRTGLAAGLLFASQKAASALTTETWNGGTSSTWETPTNWTPNTVPVDNTYSTSFGATTGSKTVNLTAAEAVGQVLFTSTAPSYTFGGSALTIDDTNYPASFTNSAPSGSTITFNNAVTFSGNATTPVTTTITNNAATLIFQDVSTVSVGANINQSNSAGSITFNGALTLTPSRSVTINNTAGTVNLNNTSVSGASVGQFTISGAGTTNISTNAFTGAVLPKIVLGSSNSNVNVFLTKDGMTLGTFVDANLSAPTSATIVFGSNVSGGGTTTASGRFALPATASNTTNTQFFAAAGNTLTYSGSITNGATTAAFTKTGAGTVILSNTTNSYVTPTIVSAGTLLVNGTGATPGTNGGAGLGTMSVSNGGTLGGNGTLAPTTTTVGTLTLMAGGTLAPGTANNTNALRFSPFGGTTTAGLVSIAAGANLNFNLNVGRTSSSLALVNSFANEVTGLSSSTNFNFIDLSGGSLTTGLYTLISTDDKTSIPFQGLSAGPQSGFTYSGVGYAGQLEVNLLANGYALQFNITSVPEPSTWVAGVCLILMAFGHRWLRRPTV